MLSHFRPSLLVVFGSSLQSSTNTPPPPPPQKKKKKKKKKTNLVRVELDPLLQNELFWICACTKQRWKSYEHRRETTVSSNDSLQLRHFSKWELLLKERIFSQMVLILSFRSELFPLRVVPLCMENHFLLFSFRTCLYCVVGATSMQCLPENSFA